jgi:hypothetical protein
LTAAEAGNSPGKSGFRIPSSNAASTSLRPIQMAGGAEDRHQSIFGGTSLAASLASEGMMRIAGGLPVASARAPLNAAATAPVDRAELPEFIVDFCGFIVSFHVW